MYSKTVQQYNLHFTEWQAVNKSAELLLTAISSDVFQVFVYMYYTLTSNFHFTISSLFMHGFWSNKNMKKQ